MWLATCTYQKPFSDLAMAATARSRSLGFFSRPMKRLLQELTISGGSPAGLWR